jgi:hypothetical protein
MPGRTSAGCPGVWSRPSPCPGTTSTCSTAGWQCSCKDAGLSGRALASATGQHFTRVSKIEHGVQTPDDDDIRAWCRACAAEGQVPDLIATARAAESAYLEFRRQSRAGMKRVTGAHAAALYERTSMFRIYEHNVIPDLFQTAAYCAAMLSFWIGFLDAPDDLYAAVAVRMERQKVVFDRAKRFPPRPARRSAGG